MDIRRSAIFSPASGAPEASGSQPVTCEPESPGEVRSATGPEPQLSLRPLASRQLVRVELAEPDLRLPTAQQLRRQQDLAMVECLLRTKEVKSAELLLHMARSGLRLQQLGVHVTAPMEAVRARLQPLLPDYPLFDLLLCLSRKQQQALVDSQLARQLLKQNRFMLGMLPMSLRTPDFLNACIADNETIIPQIFEHHPEHPVDFEKLVRHHPAAIRHIPPDARTFRLKKLAVRYNPDLLSLFREEPQQTYTSLCMIALARQGQALRHIPEQRVTQDMVELALRQAPVARLRDIPPRFRTRELCLKALAQAEPINSPAPSTGNYPKNFLHSFPELMPQRSRFYHWLDGIPEHERTESLCCEFVQQFPDALHLVPGPIRARHPEWQERTSPPPRLKDHYHSLSLNGLPDNDPGRCRALCEQYGQMMHFQDRDLRPGVPPWVCLSGGPAAQERWLPPHLKEQLMRHGGPEGPATAFETSVEPISASALLCPAQDKCCPREAALVPVQARARLLFCRPFVLRNQALGWQLQERIEQHRAAVEPTLAQAPEWTEALQTATDWAVHGGRVLCQAGQQPCRRLKFLRAGEPVAEWLTESVVQAFALEYKDRLGLLSEIPRPQGFWRVPVALLPDPAAKGMTSKLAVHSDAHSTDPYYLAFECTTRDQDYGRLAWQGDSEDSHKRAQEGMARSFHDLGVWSSLGVVHSSTAMLFHNFEDNRPEIVLPALFSPQGTASHGYPGKLTFWDTLATEQSDWGFSGLRDLGDVEFYGTMTSFLAWRDSNWQYPFYAQRAAFINSLCSNLLVGLLHYMRRNRDTPDWYYRNKAGCQRLAHWIDTEFTGFLRGFLGDDTRLEQLFPDPACYRQWLDNTAREILYWSARQYRPGEACVAEHLREQGRPCASLYPGHPHHYYTYPADFCDSQGRDHLSVINGKLPLFSLIRGFYLIAYKLADRLEGPAA